MSLQIIQSQQNRFTDAPLMPTSRVSQCRRPRMGHRTPMQVAAAQPVDRLVLPAAVCQAPRPRAQPLAEVWLIRGMDALRVWLGL